MIRFIQDLLRQLVNIDVRRAHNISDTNLSTFLKDRQIDVVIDVGANSGQFGSGLRRSGYLGKIISFEPLKAEFQKLAAIANTDGNWEANNFALGAVPGEAVINVSDDSVFSSILPLADAASRFGGALVRHTQTIKMLTLDEVASNLSVNILLKIHVQRIRAAGS